MDHHTHRLILTAAIAASVWNGGAIAQPAPTAALAYQQPLMTNEIAQVQDRLRAQGAFSGAGDGVWGPDSAAALSQFQQARGLQPTGQLNQATAMLLGLDPVQLLGLKAGAPAPEPAVPVAPSPAPPSQPVGPTRTPAASAPPEANSVLGPAAVRNLQSRLHELGYYTGGIDGQWGPQAEGALRRFQQASGIEVSGRINRQTVAAMGLDPNDPAAPARP